MILTTTRSRLAQLSADIGCDSSGMAMVEFALCLPFVVGVALTGAELTNYTTTKMRVSQIALQVADNASRIGSGPVTVSKQITETQINDLLTGAQMQSQKLDLTSRGRVIVSSLEVDPSHTGKYRIRWQRCGGAKAFTSAYGVQGTNNLNGATFNGQLLTAPVGSAVMLVEISYNYRALIAAPYVPHAEIKETAAMTVRDTRDMTGPTGGVGIYNTENAAVSSC
jgi:Flp pilus assembly protein TadG